MSIRVAVVDDQELIREGLVTVISGDPEIEVVGSAGNGNEALRVVRESRPDVVLMDIRMPELDGLEATRRLMAEPEPPRVIVLTTFDADEHVLAALRAGASGFLLKDLPKADLLAAIRAASAGDLVLAPAITRRLVDQHVSSGPDPAAVVRLEKLSDRERDVLERIATGDTNAEIAGHLFLSESTIKTHVGALLAKLDARDRVQLVIFAYEAGLARIGP